MIDGKKKFIVIILALTFSFTLSMTGKMSPEWAGIVAVCVSVYQYVQARIDENKNKS